MKVLALRNSLEMFNAYSIASSRRPDLAKEADDNGYRIIRA